MANLSSTMERARQRALVDAASEPPTVEAAAAPTERDTELGIAARLKRLDRDQLEQVAQALRGSWMLPADADEDALRQSLIDYVGEWGDDAADDPDGDDDPDAARAAGRAEAVGFVEQEMLRAIADTTPRSQWRATMGVTEPRLLELIDQAVDDGIDLPDDEVAE